MSEEQIVKIATLEADVKWIKESMQAILAQNKDMQESHREMNAALQRGKGAFTASLFFAGAIGAFSQKILAALLNTGVR